MPGASRPRVSLRVHPGPRSRRRYGGHRTRIEKRASQEPDGEGLQVLRLRDDAEAGAGHHLRGGPERLRQVQRGRRHRLGARRAGRQGAARRQDGGRHLRRHRRPGAAGPRRGHPHHRQHRRRAADRVHRGLDHPPDVPLRRERVRDQRRLLPAARHPGAALRLRHRPGDARHRRPGPARRACCTPSRRTAARSSRRRPASSSTASARRRRCASSTRCRPTSTGSPTSPPSCAASSSRWAGRPRWPGGPPASRPTCATPGCGCSPTTWPPCATTLDREIADETALRERREQVEAEHARGAGAARRAGGGARRGRAGAGRRRRTPGTSSPRCRSGCRSTAPARRASGCGNLTRRRRRRAPRPRPRPAGRRGRAGPRAGGGAARGARRRPGPARRGGRAPPGAGAPARRRRAGAGRRGQGDRRPARGAGQADRPGQRGPRPGPTAAAEEIARLAAALAEAQARAEQAQDELRRGRRRRHRGRPGQRRPGRPARRGGRRRTSAAQAARHGSSADAERAAEKDAAQWKAREEALALGLRRKDGAGALLARADQVPGLLGSVAALLTVEPGLRGGAGRRARRARRRGRGRRCGRAPARRCELLKTDDAGRAALLVGSPAGPGMTGSADALRPALPDGARWALDLVECAATSCARRCDRALRDVVFVAGPRRRAPIVVATQPGAARGHPRRRRARRVRGGRRLGQGSPATSRCRPPSRRPGSNRRRRPSAPVAELREQLGDGARRGGRRQGGGAARPPPRKREAEGQRNAAARRLAELGAAARSAQGRGRPASAQARVAGRGRPASGTWPASPSWRSGCGWPRRPRSTPTRPPRSATSSPPRCRRPGRTRWRSGSPCVPPRSGSARSPAGPTRWPGRPPPERAARERAAARRAARARGAAIARAVVGRRRDALARLAGARSPRPASTATRVAAGARRPRGRADRGTRRGQAARRASWSG